MKIKISTDEYTSLLTLFSKNFLKGGIILGIALTLVELIKYKKNLISLYAFISASFFIVNLVQFYYVDKSNPSMNTTFLIHTIIGGITWAIFSVILYVFYLLKLSTEINILFTLFIIIVTWILYYLLIEYKFITNIF